MEGSNQEVYKSGKDRKHRPREIIESTQAVAQIRLSMNEQ